MKELDFEPIKTREIFLKNYALHDIASKIGDELLKTRGFEVREFGMDRRYERVWEAGEDKPDRIVLRGGKPVCLIDWKGKSSHKYILNQRAYDSYRKVSKRSCIPCWVIFFIIRREEGRIDDVKCVEVNSAKVTKIYKEWNGNAVVQFSQDSLFSLSAFFARIS